MTEMATGLVSGQGFAAVLGSRGRRIASEKIANNTTVSALGLPAPTATGTATQLKVAQGEFTNYAAASGASCGLSYNVDLQTVTLPLFHSCIYTPGALTNARLWIGLFLADPATSDDPGTHLAGFRYSNGVDTNWMACTKDNVTLNAQSTGIAVAAATRYDLGISVATTGRILFYVNNVALVVSTSNLPGSTQNLDIYNRGRDKGAAAPVVSIAWAITNVAWT